MRPSQSGGRPYLKVSALVLFPGHNRNAHLADDLIRRRIDDGAERQAMPPLCDGLPSICRVLFRQLFHSHHSGAPPCSAPTGCTAIRVRPRSRSLRISPYSAAWSTTGPSNSVLPSAVWLMLIPSNQAAQCVSSCSLTSIRYHLGIAPSPYSTAVASSAVPACRRA